MSESPVQLTERETEIAQLVGEGRSVRRIALELGIAPSTVYNTIYAVSDKIGGHSKPYIRVLLWARTHLPPPLS